MTVRRNTGCWVSLAGWLLATIGVALAQRVGDVEVPRVADDEPGAVIEVRFGLPVTAGRVLHLDAEAITGLANGAVVAQWNDISGHLNHVRQGNNNLRPTYRTNVLNGKPVVRFVPNQHLAAANAGILNTNPPFTLLVVNVPLRPPAAWEGNYLGGIVGKGFLSNTIGWGANIGTRNAGEVTHSFQIREGVNSYSVGSEHMPEGQPYLQCVVVEAIALPDPSLTQWLNGGMTATRTYNLTDVRSTSVVTVGCRDDKGQKAWYYRGDIAEIILYNRVLSETERRAMERYLTAKWMQE